MQIRFLVIDENGAQLLGCPLKLTPTEHKLLYALCQKDMTVDELSSLLFKDVSRGNVAVHINSINRKSEAIGGRKLVLFLKDGYTVNRLM